MKYYEIKYKTECTMIAHIKANTEQEAVQKMRDFDIDEDPMEVDGGGFDEDEMEWIREL